MEQDLSDWIQKFIDLNGKQPSSSIIKKMAKRFSNFPDKFKASKGWFEKFLLRFNQKTDQKMPEDSE